MTDSILISDLAALVLRAEKDGKRSIPLADLTRLILEASMKPTAYPVDYGAGAGTVAGAIAGPVHRHVKPVE